MLFVRFMFESNHSICISATIQPFQTTWTPDWNFQFTNVSGKSSDQFGWKFKLKSSGSKLRCHGGQRLLFAFMAHQVTRALWLELCFAHQASIRIHDSALSSLSNLRQNDQQPRRLPTRRDYWKSSDARTSEPKIERKRIQDEQRQILLFFLLSLSTNKVPEKIEKPFFEFINNWPAARAEKEGLCVQGV